MEINDNFLIIKLKASEIDANYGMRCDPVIVCDVINGELIYSHTQWPTGRDLSEMTGDQINMKSVEFRNKVHLNEKKILEKFKGKIAMSNLNLL